MASTRERARTRPMAGAHSIWEIVLHVTAWADIARQRIHGEATGDPAPEQDWPPVSDVPMPTGRARSARLEREPSRCSPPRRGRSSEEQLDALVPGLDYTVDVLLHGIVEHGTYHGGQIALLKKA